VSTYGASPLYLASKLNELDMVNLLLTYGSDANQPNYKGRTPVSIASRYGFTRIVYSLIHFGNADPNIQDVYGSTPLMELCLSKNENVVDEHIIIAKYLLDNEADPNIVDIKNKTALFYSVQKNEIDLAQILLENGANPFIKDNSGKLAIEYANDPEMVAMLRSYMDALSTIYD
jgi:ankyrin repeat protein